MSMDERIEQANAIFSGFSVALTGNCFDKNFDFFDDLKFLNSSMMNIEDLVHIRKYEVFSRLVEWGQYSLEKSKKLERVI